MGSKKIYICRHGQTEANVAKVMQGWNDGKLTALGHEQARTTGQRLKDRGIELILCGDLGRQRETAAGILEYVQTPVIYTPLLKERGGGSLEGRTYASLGVEEEEDFNCYASDGQGILAPVESLESVTDRAHGVVEFLRKAPQNVILTVGSGWINSYIANILLDEEWIYHDQPNCSAHFFAMTNNWEVMHYELSKTEF
ncbi:histidine phosphatase family protein [Candidatus Woesearchaeota archaeon]|nr:histidine phosphatase family protein [Candidatus Woesearchaeota archaeon]